MLLGFETLSDGELLAIFINTGYRDTSAIDIANELLIKFDGLSNLIQLHHEQLMSVKGISSAKSIRLLALFEVLKRVNHETLKECSNKTWNPAAFFKSYRLDYFNKSKECLVLYILDDNLKVRKIIKLYEGNEEGFDIRVSEIFRNAMLYNAKNIVLTHNHPSQSELPSLVDTRFTKNLMEDCAKFGIKLVDHIIFTNKKFYSFISEMKE